MPDSRTIDIRGIGEVRFERSSRAKHLNISVKPYAGVRVAVPKGLSFEKAEEVARAKAAWIRAKLVRAKEQEQDHKLFTETTAKIDRKEARKALVKRLDELAAQHGFSYNKVFVRNQKTRWGSCSAKNNISLNVKLTQLPAELRDFIILHELVHTLTKNHSPAFWETLLRLIPDAKKRDKELGQYGCLLL